MKIAKLKILNTGLSTCFLVIVIETKIFCMKETKNAY